VVNNVENADTREVQMLQQYLGEFGQQIEVLARQLEMIEQRRIESLAAIETLSTLVESPDETVLLQLGGGASLRVKVVDPDKILLNIGSDVIIDRTNNETIEFLGDRIKEMEAMEKKLGGSIDQLQKQANEVARRIELAYKKSQMIEAGH
jgi:prefoldin alpha subunit